MFALSVIGWMNRNDGATNGLVAFLAFGATGLAILVAFQAIRRADDHHRNSVMPLLTFKRECPAGNFGASVVKIYNKGMGPALFLSISWIYSAPGRSLRSLERPDGPSILAPGDFETMRFEADWMATMLEELPIGLVNGRVLATITVDYSDVFNRTYQSKANFRILLPSNKMSGCQGVYFREQRIRLPTGKEIWEPEDRPGSDLPVSDD